MKTFSGVLFIIVFISCSKERSINEQMMFELRLAQSEPDSNLKEMVFYNSNDTFFVYDSVYITNDDIVKTEVLDWKTQPKVKVILNEAGKEKFAQFTGKYIGKNAAMIIDGQLMSAPRINAQITKGVLLIIGLFDQNEAQKISEGILLKV